jgi:Uncharacterized protein conserved in bacteria (DUF2188)
MSPHRTLEVHVIPRNLRWEVEVNGVTRRMIDWLCTKERAIDHALERAQELLRWEHGASAVVIVQRADWTEEMRLEVPCAQRKTA